MAEESGNIARGRYEMTDMSCKAIVKVWDSAGLPPGHLT